MARILLRSNSFWSLSGYGTQSLALAKMLRAMGHEVACAAFHGLHGPPLQYEGFQIFPGSTADPWIQDLLPAHYQAFGADLCISLMDAWVLDPSNLRGMNYAHWMPVDCYPLSQGDRRVLEQGGHRVIAMSRFGEKALSDAGFDPLYAPHALFMTGDGPWQPRLDREAAKEASDLFRGKFLIGVQAANQDPWRKGFWEQFAAFAEFSKRHDDALMLVHARAQHPQGCDLPLMISQLGMQDKIILGDQYPIVGGLMPEAQMAAWHGLCDVVSNCSYGEGFGLSVLQSLATGTPVVVSDNSAMTELRGAGWLAECQPWHNRGHGACWGLPLIPSIVDAYEQAYEKAGSLREQAREFALQYDAMTVAQQHWVPVLRELLGDKAVPAVAAPQPLALPAGAGA